MKIITMTTYVCNFCKKKMFRKSAMARHEQRCGKNPVNQRPCLACPNLEQVEIRYYTGTDEYYTGEPVYRGGKSFLCKVTGNCMRAPVVNYFKHKDLLDYILLDDKEVEQIDMPIKCEHCDKN